MGRVTNLVRDFVGGHVQQVDKPSDCDVFCVLEHVAGRILALDPQGERGGGSRVRRADRAHTVSVRADGAT